MQKYERKVEHLQRNEVMVGILYAEICGDWWRGLPKFVFLIAGLCSLIDITFTAGKEEDMAKCERLQLEERVTRKGVSRLFPAL